MKLQELGLIVTETMTTPKKPGKKPRPVWVVSGKVAGFEDKLKELGGNNFWGQWSFWEDPTAMLEQLEESDRQSLEQVCSSAKVVQLENRKRPESEPEPDVRPQLDSKSISLAFLVDRLEEAQAELDRVRRFIARLDITSPVREAFHNQRTEVEGRIKYWMDEIEKIGGMVFGPKDINAGDWVNFCGGWYRVKSVGERSVTIVGWLGVAGSEYAAEYAKIKGVQPANPTLRVAE